MIQQRKILFLDDDKEYVKSLSELLRWEGFQIFEAFTTGQAEQILDEAWVHMIIVDLSMTGDPKNRDGLIIVNNPKYSAIPKVILTGFDSDLRFVPDMPRIIPGAPPPVVKFIGKNDGGIDRTLTETFMANVRINWNLQIQWDSPGLNSLNTLADLVVHDNDKAYLPYRMEELEDLLRKVFFDSQQIVIGRLLKYEEEIAWMEIFSQEEDSNEKRFIVACSQEYNIKQQKLQSRKIIPQVGSRGNMVLMEMGETLRFAANKYERIDD